MKPLPATWKAVGEVLPSPAPPAPRKPRMTADSNAGDPRGTTGKVSKSAFHAAKCKWLVLVAGDRKLTRAAIGVAVITGIDSTPALAMPGRPLRTSRWPCICIGHPL